jgi:5-methyltetrahydrofolate--homocysteine methyltransferase
METILQNIYQAIIEGDREAVGENIQKALALPLDPVVILHESMIAAMAEVGRRFEQSDYFVPEMLIAARAMQNGMALLKPHLQEGDVKSAGNVIIGTVQGDLHDIGKNLVAMMLEGAGFEINDLGTDVSPEKFIDAVRAGDADILAMSALLTTTMTNMRVTIEALDQAGLRGKIKVIIGGAPVTESFAHQIGADGFATDASRAVALTKSLTAG